MVQSQSVTQMAFRWLFVEYSFWFCLTGRCSSASCLLSLGRLLNYHADLDCKQLKKDE